MVFSEFRVGVIMLILGNFSMSHLPTESTRQPLPLPLKMSLQIPIPQLIPGNYYSFYSNKTNHRDFLRKIIERH